MYYPYLRGRQFELISLRELSAEDKLKNRVLPILEPVRQSTNGFDLAFTSFQQTGTLAYIIVNSKVGKATKSSDYANMARYLTEKNPNFATFRPAFHFDDSPNSCEQILSLLDSHNLSHSLLICQNNIDYDQKKFVELINDDRIEIICINDPGRSRGLVRRVHQTEKPIVRLDDLFEPQQQNKDYLPIEEHRFSEEHLFYHKEGFLGFADYTTVPSRFSEGGTTPRAVVIHLTFLDGNDEIWIRHFTSDTNEDSSNVQGKFAEAAAKAVAFCDEHRLHNTALDELRDFYETQHYPGLGVVKKLSIKNHILVVSEYLKRQG